MIGALFFEHGNKLVAMVIDEQNYKITDQLIIDISNSGQSDEAVYVTEFSDFTQFLRRHPNMDFSYLGPKLSGTTPKFRRGFQGNVYDPGNDTRAFQQLIQPRLRNIKTCNPPKMSVITKNKEVIELLFHEEVTEAVRAIFVAMRTSLNCKYTEVPSRLKQSAEYEGKKELIELMLPASSRKRLGLATLKNAIRVWNNPTAKYQRVKQALGTAIEQETDNFISDLDIAL